MGAVLGLMSEVEVATGEGDGFPLRIRGITSTILSRYEMGYSRSCSGDGPWLRDEGSFPGGEDGEDWGRWGEREREIRR